VLPTQTLTPAAERQLIHTLMRRALFDDERAALIRRAERAGIEVTGVNRYHTAGDLAGQWEFIPLEQVRR
jgi:hypothetical protein